MEIEELAKEFECKMTNEGTSLFKINIGDRFMLNHITYNLLQKENKIEYNTLSIFNRCIFNIYKLPLFKINCIKTENDIIKKRKFSIHIKKEPMFLGDFKKEHFFTIRYFLIEITKLKENKNE